MIKKKMIEVLTEALPIFADMILMACVAYLVKENGLIYTMTLSAIVSTVVTILNTFGKKEG